MKMRKIIEKGKVWFDLLIFPSSPKIVSETEFIFEFVFHSSKLEVARVHLLTVIFDREECWRISINIASLNK